jgi:Kdo2-lipid IVA lauroyltransferase/acyltransferase
MRKTIDFLSCMAFLLFAIIIGLIPFRLLYFLSDFLAWFLRKILKYRIHVVRQNISQSKLTTSPEHTNVLIKEIYRNLADVLLEGIKSFTMSRASVLKRHKVLNPELATPYYEKKQSLILATGHIGNWEWGSLSAGIQTPFRILGFYKPLKNKCIDRFLRNSRSKFGTILAPIRKTSLSFEKYQEIPTVFLMAADQNPSHIKQAYWVNFLGRKTAFLHGLEKHARNNQLPVIFAEINRVKRGMYELQLSILADKPSAYESGEITAIYARKLESSIRKNPDSWLWTHRRWKHKPS